MVRSFSSRRGGQVERSELSKSSSSPPPSLPPFSSFQISDGFGPASETFARDFYKHLNGLSYQDKFAFPLDKLLVGSSRVGPPLLRSSLLLRADRRPFLSQTRSSNSLVTDSAAGATAFSCMQKSYNGAVSVEAEGSFARQLLRPSSLIFELTRDCF